MSEGSSTPAANDSGANGSAGSDKLLFWACFISLIATAFGFVVRNQIINDWGAEFGLTETQKGEIFGVGLWPFAISIVLFSLVIDKIGYGKAMVFAFVCHIASAILTIFATGYWTLYIGTLIVALGNGTVEAVINPVVATMFPREKTKWLSILHAGWPGGLVLGGVLAIGIGDWDWRWKVALIFIPTVTYGVMLLGRRFPVHERVLAGVSYKEMLRELGGLGALIVLLLIFGEVGRVFGWHWSVAVVSAVVLAGAFGAYVQHIGRPMFILLLLIMVPLATTELGTDSWITALMEEPMAALNLHPGWVLIYTSMIMMVLRFYAGPIVHVLSPLGLLAVSALVAAVGLVFLSTAVGTTILVAATIYGFGKTFFWPAMLGVVAEQFPKGGALTLNTIAGVGMLGVGVVGNPFLGNTQDNRIVSQLEEEHRTLYGQVVEKEEQLSIFGRYRALDREAMVRIQNPVALYEREQALIEELPEERPSEEQITQALAEDDDYFQLVQATYDTLIREEGDITPRTFEQMRQALQEQGLLVDEQGYQSLKESAEVLQAVTNQARRDTLATVAIFPVIMLICYLGLILYFRTQGGYKAEVLVGHAAEDEEFTGGVEGPADP